MGDISLDVVWIVLAAIVLIVVLAILRIRRWRIQKRLATNSSQHLPDGQTTPIISDGTVHKQGPISAHPQQSIYGTQSTTHAIQQPPYGYTAHVIPHGTAHNQGPISAQSEQPVTPYPYGIQQNTQGYQPTTNAIQQPPYGCTTPVFPHGTVHNQGPVDAHPQTEAPVTPYPYDIQQSTQGCQSTTHAIQPTHYVSETPTYQNY